MNEEMLTAFIQWLPTKFEELQDKSPEEIVGMLEQMSKTEEGQKQLDSLVKAFQQEASQAGMFRKGGKLDYFVEKFAKGGKKVKKCATGGETELPMGYKPAWMPYGLYSPEWVEIETGDETKAYLSQFNTGGGKKVQRIKRTYPNSPEKINISERVITYPPSNLDQEPDTIYITPTHIRLTPEKMRKSRDYSHYGPTFKKYFDEYRFKKKEDK